MSSAVRCSIEHKTNDNSLCIYLFIFFFFRFFVAKSQLLWDFSFKNIIFFGIFFCFAGHSSVRMHQMSIRQFFGNLSSFVYIYKISSKKNLSKKLNKMKMVHIDQGQNNLGLLFFCLNQITNVRFDYAICSSIPFVFPLN